MLKKNILNLKELELFTKEWVSHLEASQKNIVFLRGDLGSGKTTFSQFVLQALGYTGRVKSPTYTLIEPYEINGQKVYHLDLYRLQNAEELYFLGISDHFNEKALFLIEWPEKLVSLGIQPDYEIELSVDSNQPDSRILRILS